MRTKIDKSCIAAKVGNAIVFSFINYKETGFSPYDSEEPSWEHYKSNEVFKDVPFELWKEAARKLMVNARLCIPKEPHYTAMEEYHHSKPKPSSSHKVQIIGGPLSSTKRHKSGLEINSGKQISKKFGKETAANFHKGVSPPPLSHKENPIDGIFHVIYPRKEIFVKIDLVGDIFNKASHKVEISPCGTCVSYFSKVPSVYFDLESVLPPDTPDTFRYLLKTKMSNRLKDVSPDEYRLQKTLRLPFPVKRAYFDSKFNAIATYPVIITEKAIAYTAFWLLPHDR